MCTTKCHGCYIVVGNAVWTHSFPPFTIYTQQNPFPVSVHGAIMPVSMDMRRINMFYRDIIVIGVSKIAYLLYGTGTKLCSKFNSLCSVRMPDYWVKVRFLCSCPHVHSCRACRLWHANHRHFVFTHNVMKRWNNIVIAFDQSWMNVIMLRGSRWYTLEVTRM